MIFHKSPQHLNWVQFAMKLGKKRANVALRFNMMLNMGFSFMKSSCSDRTQ